MRLEVHTHSYVTGEVVNGKRVRPFGVSKITHSHEAGDVPHQHEGMGPATYTGAVGGGHLTAARMVQQFGMTVER